MKIYVVTDMEGLAGVFTREQVSGERGNADYELARKFLTVGPF